MAFRSKNDADPDHLRLAADTMKSQVAVIAGDVSDACILKGAIDRDENAAAATR